MPQVELIGPNRMNVGGHVYLKGEIEDVDFDTAIMLRDNPRFKVTGLDTRAAVEHAENQRKPTGGALFAAILEAQDRLDLDNDESFDRLGKPSVAALSKVLGYQITVAERDAALKAASKVAHGEDGKSEKVSPAEIAAHADGRSPGKIKIKKPADAAAEEEGVTV